MVVVVDGEVWSVVRVNWIVVCILSGRSGILLGPEVVGSAFVLWNI